MTPADVSVVIPALNEAQCIGIAIESAFAAGAGQVIVADGGSQDETRSIAAAAGATVCQSERGRGNQLRKGAERADGSFLLFLHADNRLGKDCLREISLLIQSTHAETESASLIWGGFQQTISQDGWLMRLVERGNAARIRYRGMPFGDQGMFVSRTLYHDVGGVRDLPLMEDVDLAIRLRKRSWPCLLKSRVWVDARRWETRGIVRQTLRNWGIQVAHACGVSETRLSSWYR